MYHLVLDNILTKGEWGKEGVVFINALKMIHLNPGTNITLNGSKQRSLHLKT